MTSSAADTRLMTLAYSRMCSSVRCSRSQAQSRGHPAVPAGLGLVRRRPGDDAPQQHRGDRVARGVHGERQHPVEREQRAADRRPEQVRRRLHRLVEAERLGQPRTVDQIACQYTDGGAEQRGGHALDRGHRDQLPEAHRAAERRGQRHAAEGRAAHQVGAEHDRAPAPPVHQHAGRQPEGQPGAERDGGDRTGLHRAAAEGEHQQREGDRGDRRTQRGHHVAEEGPPVVRVLPQHLGDRRDAAPDGRVVPVHLRHLTGGRWRAGGRAPARRPGPGSRPPPWDLRARTRIRR